MNKPKNSKVILASEIPPVQWMSSGIETLDKATGGGLPLGRMITISGLQSSAKTSLALFLIAQAQKKGVACLFVDAEHSFNPAYSAKLGVNLKALGIVIPNYAEEALEAAEEQIRGNKAKLIVVDSVAALSARAEVEAAYEGAQMALQARFMSRALRKLTPLIAEKKAVFVWINQLRQNIMGGYASSYIETGGMALKFYSSLSLRLKRVETLRVDDRVAGLIIEALVQKNKVGVPEEKARIELRFDSGFTGEIDRLENMLTSGEVEQRGRTYFLGEEKLGVGWEAASQALIKK